MAHMKVTDTNAYAQDVKNKLHVLRQDFRETIYDIEDPRMRALLETSSEVINGLEKAFDHFSRKSDESVIHQSICL